VKTKKLHEGLKHEMLAIMTDRKRAALERRLLALTDQVAEIKRQLEEDRNNRLRRQWFIRGWTARNP